MRWQLAYTVKGTAASPAVFAAVLVRFRLTFSPSGLFPILMAVGYVLPFDIGCESPLLLLFARGSHFFKVLFLFQFSSHFGIVQDLEFWIVQIALRLLYFPVFNTKE